MIALLVLLACGEPAPPPGPDVVLVVVDTLRADHLGVYGYDRPVSPHLDALAAGAIVYTDATSSTSWTLPSFASLVTGAWPYRHGAGVHNGAENTRAPLARDGLPTVAERFAAHGWHTGAIVSNPYLTRRFGIDRGFAHYDDRLATLPDTPEETVRQWKRTSARIARLYRPANEMTDAAIAWWTSTPAPRFLMLHYMDVHTPRRPPAEDRRAVGGDGDVAAYDASIRYVDRELARFLAAAGEPIVVFTADHGEELGQRPGVYAGEDLGATGHGHTLYQELVRVPLVVRAPGRAPQRVDRPVRTVDVPTTLLALAGLPGLPGDGVPLWEALGGPPVADEPPVIAHALRYGTEKRAARRGPLKLIDTRFGPELYDLAADPGERDNLAATRPDDVTRLAAELPPVSDAPVHAIDDQTREALRGLGYVE